MAHRKIIAFPSIGAVNASRFHRAALKTDPKLPEPAQADQEDGKPVRVWFTGIDAVSSRRLHHLRGNSEP